MDSIEKDLCSIADVFIGRLPDLYVDDVKELADFREWGLSFRVLCDQLLEYDVKITNHEWEKINEIGNDIMGERPEEYDWSALKKLIQINN